jgi:hypothetical protein
MTNIRKGGVGSEIASAGTAGTGESTGQIIRVLLKVTVRFCLQGESTALHANPVA